jgi:hypothetical protein
MKNLTKPDWISLLTFIAGGGLAGLGQILTAMYPGYSANILNVIAIAAVLAGMILRLFTTPSGPAQAVMQNAPTIAPSGAVVGVNLDSSHLVQTQQTMSQKVGP